MQTSSEYRPVIILGVDRSGTSLVAKLTHDWGAYGGDIDTLAWPDSHNPRGYWEPRSLVLFMNEIFQAVGHDFWRAGYEEDLKAKSKDPAFAEPARALIAQMEREARPAWFWKEPLLSVQLPFWRHLWGDATYVVTVRNPYDSAVSWEKMMLPPELKGRISMIGMNLLRWQHFLLSILAHIDSSPRKIFIPYEDLIRDPESQCERLCIFLDQETGLDRWSEGRVRVMKRSVDPALWRNNSRTDFDQIALATREQKELLRLLRRKVENPEEQFDDAAYPLYPAWREVLGNFAELQAFFRSANERLGSPHSFSTSASLLRVQPRIEP